MKTYSLLLSLLCLISFPSCTMLADPEYLQNIQAVTDTNYPSSKVHGGWVSFSSNFIAYGVNGVESRTNYLFEPGGVGLTQQHTKYLYPNLAKTLTIEAPLQWKYLGANRWQIHMPGSGQYKVIEKHPDLTTGHLAPYTIIVRYHNGRLYNTTNMQILVPLTQSASYIRSRRARLQQNAAIFIPQPVSY